VPFAWNGSSATVGAPIALPVTSTGAQHAITESGTATSESELALSADGRYLTLGGYAAAVGTAKVNSTTSAASPRVIARIDGAGNIDTSTALTDAFSTSNFRGVVSDDGTRFWATGDGGSVASGSDKNAGVVYAATLGATSSTALESSNLNSGPKQGRAVTIAGGNLYFTTGSSPGPGVFQLGPGLPTATATITKLNSEADPYGVVVLHTGPTGTAPDTMYVADGTAGGIFKYTLAGSTWTASGSVAGPPLEGLAGRVEGASVALYATTADGGTGGNRVLALTDASGFGNPIAGTFATVATAPLNTAYKGIAFAPTGQVLSAGPPAVALSDTALSRSIGDSYSPSTVTATVSDSLFPADQLTVTASAAGHAGDANVVSGVTVDGGGSTRTITVASQDTVGLSDVTVTVTTPDGRSATSTFQYGVSEQAPDATSNWLYDFSNASTAIDVGDGYYIVGDDTFNVLAMYKEGVSGKPVATWNFDPQMGIQDSSQIDIEASSRMGDTIYWFGSEGNNSTGDVKANRAVLFATTVTGSGASTSLAFAGFYKNLRSDLIAWDASNGDQFGFAAGAAQGQIPKEINGFNIEGAEFAAGGSGTLYLGFRAPIVPTSNRTQALVIPVTNLPSLISATGTTGAATFGSPLRWNLTPSGYANGNGDPSALGIREIRKNADDQYLIIAGSYEGVPPAPDGGAEFLYTWDGDPAHQPILTDTKLPTPGEGSWETIVAVPDPLTQGSSLWMVQDDGDVAYYGDGVAAKDSAAGLQKGRADVIELELAPQTIAISSTPASPAYVGTTYTIQAAGGASGSPLVFGIDASSTPGACTISGGTVSLLAAGSCVVDADQAGSFQYAPAARVTQTIPVVLPPAPVVTPTVTGTLGNGGWYVSDATVTWTIASPVPASSCSATTVSADTAGTPVTCTSTSVGGSTTVTVTVAVDQTKPAIAFAGNAGSYTVAQNVAITCAASDPAPGSGLASTTCANVSAPAWTYGLGTTTLSASAVDVAGNTRSASTSFTITVTPTSLCTLTTAFVKGSANYAKLNPLAQRVVDLLVSGTCNTITQLTPKLKPPAAAALIKVYAAAVNGLASSGWLTKAQAATLAGFAGSL
jgi:hypothetical protein